MSADKRPALPTGISSREHTLRGKTVKQYRASLSDRSRKSSSGASARVTSKWFSTLAEARQWLDDQRKRLAQTGTLQVNRRITIAECTTDWIDRSARIGMAGRAPISEVTAERYASILSNVIDPTIGSLRMADLRASQMRIWVEDLAGDKGHDAAHRALGLLKMVYQYAVASEIVPVSPVSAISIAKRSSGQDSDDDDGNDGDRAPENVMSPSEASSLRQAFDRLADGIVKSNKSVRGVGEYQLEQRRLAFVRWRMLFYTLYLTGMRIGEASALQWKHIDAGRQLIRIEQSRKRRGKVGAPKTRNSKRTITIGAQLAVMLEKYRGNLGDDLYVFADRRPLHPRRFYMAWKTALELALLDGWTPHDLRHFHASSLINKGVLPQQVCDRLGHANVTITLSIYAHLFRALSGAGNMAGAELEGELLC